MHVSKSVLIFGVATILLLAVSLAYVMGKSSPGSADAIGMLPPKASNTNAAEPTAGGPMEQTTIGSKAPAKTPNPKAKTAAQSPKPFSTAEQRLIDAWSEAMEMCRGSPDEESQKVWCPRYVAAQKRLNQAGICFGHDDDQSAADYDIHRCRKGSYRD